MSPSCNPEHLPPGKLLKENKPIIQRLEEPKILDTGYRSNRNIHRKMSQQKIVLFLIKPKAPMGTTVRQNQNTVR